MNPATGVQNAVATSLPVGLEGPPAQNPAWIHNGAAVAADGTLYVGDTVHADVRGARAAGMAMVQLDPYDDHAGFDHHRVRDLGELADLLGG